MASYISITSANGDRGMREVSHPSLAARVFRVHNGALEWAYEQDFDDHGWRARTYGSVLPMSHFGLEA